MENPSKRMLVTNIGFERRTLLACRRRLESFQFLRQSVSEFSVGRVRIILYSSKFCYCLEMKGRYQFLASKGIAVPFALHHKVNATQITWEETLDSAFAAASIKYHHHATHHVRREPVCESEPNLYCSPSVRVRASVRVRRPHCAFSYCYHMNKTVLE